MKTALVIAAAAVAAFVQDDPKPESIDGALKFTLPAGWRFSRESVRERTWVSGRSSFAIEEHKEKDDNDPAKAREAMISFLLSGGAELLRVGSKETGAGKAMHIRYVCDGFVGDMLYLAKAGRCYWIWYERPAGDKCAACAPDDTLEALLKSLRWK